MSLEKKLRPKKTLAVCDLITSYGGVQRVMANLLPPLTANFNIVVVDPYANHDYASCFCDTRVKTFYQKSLSLKRHRLKILEKFQNGSKKTGRAVNMIVLSVLAEESIAHMPAILRIKSG